MALGINTNVASLSAQNQLNSSQRINDQALERLSSGLRINSAKDDAAGLAISTRFQSQISGLNVAQRNANDGISLAQTAEGALEETVNSLQRIRDLALQAANGTNSASDRASLQEEVDQLVSEVDRIATTTQFNGQNILDGSFDGEQFQVGANANQTISVSIGDAQADALGANATVTSTGTTLADDVAAATITGNAALDLSINGTAISTQSDGVSTAGDSGSALAFANAINAVAGTTGVTAEANATETNLGAITAETAGIDAGDFTINGVNISVSEVTNGDTSGSLRDAINTVSNQTGVKASLNDSNELVLSAEDGRNIAFGGTGAADSAIFANLDASGGAIDNIVTGTVSLDSDESFEITADQADAGVQGQGFSSGTQALDTSNSIGNIDISSVTGANDAIANIDRALDTVNSLRGTLGATQNRFESTITNLATTSENLSAANSRILDADFAAETAKLSKSQVLQQAGISVLAQANARPQQVLSLLQ
ncbi:flagellin [Marinobacter sp. ATCH36]|uniref:flagellin N-terminal helical domain-containing protein n=1 Tax=Marinobacter sp. ATCH36 TaxID=2945106 RepID=UPI0020206B1A|nr:flagellin [Marinobacter sp. ATCH36]MCL7945078.1 flagellin [Marinobacter sp. ATCH36]